MAFKFCNQLEDDFLILLFSRMQVVQCLRQIFQKSKPLPTKIYLKGQKIQVNRYVHTNKASRLMECTLFLTPQRAYIKTTCMK